MSKRVKASAVVDSQQEVKIPLDFSFKGIGIFHDTLREKPRTRGNHGALVLEDELAADDSTDTMDLKIMPSTSTALRLNNNMLNSWEGFSETVGKLFVQHTEHLCWLDLSFNELRTIDDCILELLSLTMLYLHGNNMGRIAEVNKLSSLERLKSFTLHGNPVETNPGYRQYIICQLPQLQTFDFSAVTKSDHAMALTWRTMIAPPKRPRSKAGKKQTADE